MPPTTSNQRSPGPVDAHKCVYLTQWTRGGSKVVRPNRAECRWREVYWTTKFRLFRLARRLLTERRRNGSEMLGE
ncbi:hypothetical protein GWI33_011221 [Rhynchophorus ferrugineus]|uniref:Uncharacterized protein n=1 Tax=Rhynchophorus ferrugineus TaxID=354439 RepID=A0A834I7A5_RHYFE|nr:hypothetical protein GWI33_011221 [Rhynchophorus ferrugineus]